MGSPLKKPVFYMGPISNMILARCSYGKINETYMQQIDAIAFFMYAHVFDAYAESVLRLLYSSSAVATYAYSKVVFKGLWTTMAKPDQFYAGSGEKNKTNVAHGSPCFSL